MAGPSLADDAACSFDVSLRDDGGADSISVYRVDAAAGTLTAVGDAVSVGEGCAPSRVVVPRVLR